MIDPQIQQCISDLAPKVWRGVAPRLIEAVVLVESGGDALAASQAGAVGLMQVMPATAKQMGVAEELLTDPEHNLRAGIAYLRRQFEHFPELGLFHERMSCALASYNGGRGYVNAALALAREACGCVDSSQPGPWQAWEVAGPYLLDPRCTVPSGRGTPRRLRPDGPQMLTYVARVRATFWRLVQAAQEEIS